MASFLLLSKWEWFIRIWGLGEVGQNWELDSNKEIYKKGGMKSLNTNSTYFTFLPGLAEGKETFSLFPLTRMGQLGKPHY